MVKSKFCFKLFSQKTFNDYSMYAIVKSDKYWYKYRLKIVSVKSEIKNIFSKIHSWELSYYIHNIQIYTRYRHMPLEWQCSGSIFTEHGTLMDFWDQNLSLYIVFGHVAMILTAQKRKLTARDLQIFPNNSETILVAQVVCAGKLWP